MRDWGLALSGLVNAMANAQIEMANVQIEIQMRLVQDSECNVQESGNVVCVGSWVTCTASCVIADRMHVGSLLLEVPLSGKSSGSFRKTLASSPDSEI
eukprot:163390-Prymnesium_polylepis.2